LPTLEGHRRGYEKFKEVGEWAQDRGIDTLTFYAFSTENWNRSAREVGYLMKLFREMIVRDILGLHHRGIRFRVIGKLTELARDLQRSITEAMELTQDNRRSTLNVAINYGGRLEILEAVKRLLGKGLKPGQVTEAAFASELDTAGGPDPDLIIRTSGEQRLSNFLTWQSAYSELYFTKKYWPAFNEKDFDAALAEYDRRQRRFGK
jgi:undecaprenyl diphosphate synthase